MLEICLLLFPAFVFPPFEFVFCFVLFKTQFTLFPGIEFRLDQVLSFEGDRCDLFPFCPYDCLAR